MLPRLLVRALWHGLDDTTFVGSCWVALRRTVPLHVWRLRYNTTPNDPKNVVLCRGALTSGLKRACAMLRS